MKTLSAITVILLFIILFSVSCSNESQTEPNILPGSGIEITDAWARPARENGVTAVYFRASNGSEAADTLIALSSPVAGLSELHETYEREEGMMGMREAENPSFPGMSTVVLQPGGKHIMLMQLNKPLAEGDEIEVILEFAQAGEITLTVPVQDGQPD